MNAFREARCSQGHEFLWLTGTPCICPTCGNPVPARQQACEAGDTLIKLLTPRERQVLALIAEGLTNKEIAERLTIGEFTVINHTHNIFTKLGVRSRTEAARWAWEHGVVSEKPFEPDQDDPDSEQRETA